MLREDDRVIETCGCVVGVCNKLQNGRCNDKNKKKSEKKCFFFSLYSVMSETFLIHRRSARDIIKNVYRSSCKVPVIVVRF